MSSTADSDGMTIKMNLVQAFAHLSCPLAVERPTLTLDPAEIQIFNFALNERRVSPGRKHDGPGAQNYYCVRWV